MSGGGSDEYLAFPRAPTLLGVHRFISLRGVVEYSSSSSDDVNEESPVSWKSPGFGVVAREPEAYGSSDEAESGAETRSLLREKDERVLACE